MANRILTREEVTEQNLKQATIIVNAFLNDAEPWGEKVKQSFNLLRDDTERFQIRSANIRSALGALPHMPKAEKEKRAKEVWSRMLPTNGKK